MLLGYLPALVSTPGIRIITSKPKSKQIIWTQFDREPVFGFKIAGQYGINLGGTDAALFFRIN